MSSCWSTCQEIALTAIHALEQVDRGMTTPNWFGAAQSSKGLTSHCWSTLSRVSAWARRYESPVSQGPHLDISSICIGREKFSNLNTSPQRHCTKTTTLKYDSTVSNQPDCLQKYHRNSVLKKAVIHN